MRFVVFGLSVSSAWGNGHATLWRGLLRALGSQGHEIAFFERDAPYYAAHRDMPRGEGYDLVIYPTWEEVAPVAKDAVARADVAVVTSYQADAQRAIELVLGACRGARLFYDLDTPVTLERLGRGDDVPWIPSAGLGGFDLVLSYTGGASLTALTERLGAKRAEALYGSVDAAAHHPAAPRREWASALSYLGTYAADRQRGVEDLLLAVAERAPGERFLLGGPMYPASMRRPPNLTQLPHVAPGDHPAFYASARATLNVTRAAMKQAGYCPSARLFEAAACGAPIVSDAWDGLGLFFEPGREIVIAETTDDVVRALRDPRALEEVARRARERTLAEHTADHRAARLVELVRSVPPRAGASAA